MYLFEHHDFPDLLQQTASTLKIPSVFVEKDYWVTYVLFRLQQEKVEDFLFKGGTSLTKGWNLLDRFSEDIDLLFFPHSMSENAKEKRLRAINRLVGSFKGLTYDPSASKSRGAYRADCFRYLRHRDEPLGSLAPHLKLEMGYRGGDSPQERLPIQSYVGRLLTEAGSPNLADDIGVFEINVLDKKRTFVEKIFAIHSAYQNQSIEKYVRHYYDVYQLLGLVSVQEFLKDAAFQDIKSHVAELSQKHFPETQIPDELDFATSQAFQKTEDLVKIIDQALINQGDLFTSPPPTATEILERLSKFICGS